MIYYEEGFSSCSETSGEYNILDVNENNAINIQSKLKEKDKIIKDFSELKQRHENILKNKIDDYYNEALKIFEDILKLNKNYIKEIRKIGYPNILIQLIKEIHTKINLSKKEEKNIKGNNSKNYKKLKKLVEKNSQFYESVLISEEKEEDKENIEINKELLKQDNENINIVKTTPVKPKVQKDNSDDSDYDDDEVENDNNDDIEDNYDFARRHLLSLEDRRKFWLKKTDIKVGKKKKISSQNSSMMRAKKNYDKIFVEDIDEFKKIELKNDNIIKIIDKIEKKRNKFKEEDFKYNINKLEFLQNQKLGFNRIFEIILMSISLKIEHSKNYSHYMNPEFLQGLISEINEFLESYDNYSNFDIINYNINKSTVYTNIELYKYVLYTLDQINNELLYSYSQINTDNDEYFKLMDQDDNLYNIYIKIYKFLKSEKESTLYGKISFKILEKNYFNKNTSRDLILELSENILLSKEQKIYKNKTFLMLSIYNSLNYEYLMAKEFMECLGNFEDLEKNIGVRFLYNRALLYLGKCAFYNKFYFEAFNILFDIIEDGCLDENTGQILNTFHKYILQTDLYPRHLWLNLSQFDTILFLSIILSNNKNIIENSKILENIDKKYYNAMNFLAQLPTKENLFLFKKYLNNGENIKAYEEILKNKYIKSNDNLEESINKTCFLNYIQNKNNKMFNLNLMSKKFNLSINNIKMVLLDHKGLNFRINLKSNILYLEENTMQNNGNFDNFENLITISNFMLDNKNYRNHEQFAKLREDFYQVKNGVSYKLYK